jgi:hypothetical protein
MLRLLRTLAAAACLAAASLVSSQAQIATPGLPVVPQGYCQLSATQLGSAVGLASCVRASFTASAGSPSTLLVVTSVTGIILPGDTVAGTGITAGTTILNQVSGTTGGAGTYTTSLANTASSASLTSGGIPAGANAAYLQAEVASVRFRDDGAVPTAAIGGLIVSGIPGTYYAGCLACLQFIAASGSPLLSATFYRSP